MKRRGINASDGCRSPRVRKGEASSVMPNRHQWQFNLEVLDERWGTDITYIDLRRLAVFGCGYLSVLRQSHQLGNVIPDDNGNENGVSGMLSTPIKGVSPNLGWLGARNVQRENNLSASLAELFTRPDRRCSSTSLSTSEAGAGGGHRSIEPTE